MLYGRVLRGEPVISQARCWAKERSGRSRCSGGGRCLGDFRGRLRSPWHPGLLRQPPGQAGDGGDLEEARQGQLGAVAVGQPGDELGGQQGVAAELEEAVPPPHPADPQQLPPHRRQLPLQLAPGLLVRGRQTAAVVPLLRGARDFGRSAASETAERGRAEASLSPRAGERERGRVGRSVTSHHLHPVPPPLERVRRQRQPPPGAAVEAVPVDRGAGEPEAAGGGQQVLHLAPALVAPRQARHRHPGAARRLALGSRRRLGPVGLDRQAPQGVPRADLQKDPGRVPAPFREGGETVGEAHRLQEGAHPVVRIDGLLVGHPVAGEVRRVRHLRRRQVDLLEQPAQVVRHRRHGGGVEGVAGAQGTADVPLRRQRLPQGADPLGRAGHHRQARAVDRADRELSLAGDAGETGRHLALRQRHGEHRPRRQRGDQPARRATSQSACSKGIVPARQAAVYSPRL